MWFTLDSFDYYPLSCVVGSDMQIYVSAHGVAKIMGYIDVYGFARRYSRLALRDVVPEHLKTTTGKKYPLLDLDRVCHLMRKKGRGYPVYFRRIFEEGRVRKSDKPVAGICRKTAPTIEADLGKEESEGGENVGTWIQAFKDNLRATLYRKDVDRLLQPVEFPPNQKWLMFSRLPTEGGFSISKLTSIISCR
jgi:hypothetical protein